jgi:hypothetical protein
MAIVATDWTVTRLNGNVRYVGAAHGDTLASYATVIELHRWLQDLADDASSSGDDELDITDEDPSARSTDNIITLKGIYNLDDSSSEHLYDGSVIQGSGGTEVIYDGIVNFGNSSVQLQVLQNGAVLSDDWWNRSIGGSHDGSSAAQVLTDSGSSWTTDEWVGYTLYNDTDGSYGIITANTSTTITTDELFGGTDDDWDASDDYFIGVGVNADSTSGISHRFLVKVRDAGVDIDNRKLIGTNRRFKYTFGEFSINATARGNNVLALADSTDLNNTSNVSTVDGWSSITNQNEGYVGIDVDNNGADEYYYSDWDANLPTRTTNEFYERMKYLTRDGSSETIYGLSGEVFRGITHEVDIDNPSGTFQEPEAVSWSGTNTGSGQLLAIDSTTSGTKMWIQLLTGSAPADDDTITGANAGTADTNGSVTERTIASPFVGQSTGSALIGSYGLGLETNDLTNSDTLFDLDNVAVNPPNNVTFAVAGLISSEDRVLVAPWDGVTTDNNGDPSIEEDQLSLATVLDADNESSVVVSESIPTDTPTTGTIRVVDDNGRDRRLEYSSWAGSTFTITSTDGEEDFSGDEAAISNDVYITYVDLLATSSTESFTGVYLSDRDLVVFVRDGGGTPIKQFVTSAVFSSSNTTVTAIRTTDE